MAMIEYKACKEEVDALLAQDFNSKLIHEKLTKEGRFTMAYPSFSQILRKAENKIPSARPVPAESRQTPPVRPQRRPGIISADPEPFPDPRNIDPKTLI